MSSLSKTTTYLAVMVLVSICIFAPTAHAQTVTYPEPASFPSPTTFPQYQMTWNVKEILDAQGPAPVTTIEVGTPSTGNSLAASAIMAGNISTRTRSFFPHSFFGWLGTILLLFIVMAVSRKLFYEPMHHGGHSHFEDEALNVRV